MKISSSMVEYNSTHFLGTQEQDSNYSKNDVATTTHQSIHAEEQMDVAYEVQLTGKAAQEAVTDKLKSIYQVLPHSTVEGAMDIQAASEAELAKLSPEDQQKVQLIKNHVGVLLGENTKVVLAPQEDPLQGNKNNGKNPLFAGDYTEKVVNQNIAGTISSSSTQLSGSIHSKKTTDIDQMHATVHAPSGNLGLHWGTIGTMNERAEHSTVGQNTVIFSQGDEVAAESARNVDKVANVLGTTTLVGDKAVFIPDTDENGKSTGLRVGDLQSQSHKITEEEYTTWTAKGTVQTADGKNININQTSMMLRTAETEKIQATANLDDPLVIQYGEGTVGLTDQKYNFDLNADGQQDQISFVKPGAGFLALDNNDDGKINDGSELFGTKSGNGFKDLGKYDGDGNGWIDENDKIYSKLRIWSKDEQGNNQLMTLKEAGVGAIYLGSISTEFSLKDKDNNLQGQVRQSGFFLHENGTTGTVQQIDLVRGSAVVDKNNSTSGHTILSGAVDDWKQISSSQQTEIVLKDSARVNVEETDGGIIIRNKPRALVGINMEWIHQNQYKEMSSIHYGNGAIFNYSKSLTENSAMTIGVASYKIPEKTSGFINYSEILHNEPNNIMENFLWSAGIYQTLKFNTTLEFFNKDFDITPNKKDIGQNNKITNDKKNTEVKNTSVRQQDHMQNHDVKVQRDQSILSLLKKNSQKMRQVVDLHL